MQALFDFGPTKGCGQAEKTWNISRTLPKCISMTIPECQNVFLDFSPVKGTGRAKTTWRKKDILQAIYSLFEVYVQFVHSSGTTVESEYLFRH